MRGSVMSSTYRPRPVSRRGSSRRLSGAPTCGMAASLARRAQSSSCFTMVRTSSRPIRTSSSSTGSATRSPSSRPTSTPPLRGCSISSVTSTRAGAGTPASCHVPTGCAGGWGSSSGPPGNASAWRGRSARCRGWRKGLPARSCRTPRSGRSRASRRPRPKSGYSRLVWPAPPSTSNGSSGAGAGWIARRKRRRRRDATSAAPLHVYHDEDGMVIIRARLEPEAGAVVVQALAAAREALHRRARATDAVGGSAGPRFADGPAGPGYVDGSPEAPTIEQQEADALALVAETALHRGIDPGTPGERYQVVVHVDAAVLADADSPGQSVLEGGTHVPAGTSQRLACDATRVGMRHDADGQITEVGARTRTIPPPLRRPPQHRDHGCRFPGCGRTFGQGHHIRHWASGGPTTLSNLTMLCRRHHRAVHEEGFRVERQADGELCFRRPDGRLLPESPTLPPVPADPIGTLRARNEAEGIHIDAQTSKPGWLGERLDVGYAIDVLHPLAIGY